MKLSSRYSRQTLDMESRKMTEKLAQLKTAKQKHLITRQVSKSTSDLRQASDNENTKQAASR